LQKDQAGTGTIQNFTGNKHVVAEGGYCKQLVPDALSVYLCRLASTSLAPSGFSDRIACQSSRARVRTLTVSLAITVSCMGNSVKKDTCRWWRGRVKDKQLLQSVLHDRAFPCNLQRVARSNITSRRELVEKNE
jgi:hypothetical protein